MWKVTLNNTDGHSHSPVAADTSLCRPDQEKTNQNNQIFCSILCWPDEERTNQYNQIFCSIFCWPEEKNKSI